MSVIAHEIIADTKSPRCSTAFSAVYVFKNDCQFKEIYGHGMINIITGNFVYYPWDFWGIGATTSYWRAKGRTTFLQFCTTAKEIPLTFSIRRLVISKHDIEFYAALGGGVTWLKEKSDIEQIKLHKEIGEIEVGLKYPIYHCLKLTTAFRYLFPPQCICDVKTDVGGVDLRAGFELSF